MVNRHTQRVMVWIAIVVLILGSCRAPAGHLAFGDAGRGEPGHAERLYVGRGFGGSVGFLVCDGLVTGGFLMPVHWRQGDDIQHLAVDENMVLPIRRVKRVGDETYEVAAADGPLDDLLLVIASLDDRALSYRITMVDHGNAVAYSGVAASVDIFRTNR